MWRWQEIETDTLAERTGPFPLGMGQIRLAPVSTLIENPPNLRWRSLSLITLCTRLK